MHFPFIGRDGHSWFLSCLMEPSLSPTPASNLPITLLLALPWEQSSRRENSHSGQWLSISAPPHLSPHYYPLPVPDDHLTRFHLIHLHIVPSRSRKGKRRGRGWGYSRGRSINYLLLRTDLQVRLFLLSTVHTLFRFPWLLPSVFLQFQGPTQDNTWHLVTRFLRCLLAVTVSPPSFVLGDFDSFGEYLSGIL